MNRLSRWCAWMLLALGACLVTALPARAATATATLQQGPLSITPTYVTLTYRATGRGAERTVASSFSVNVTDARGTKAGWEISAVTVSTTGPSGYFPTDAHVITDFNIVYANGTPPDPTGPCDIIPTAQPGMILHNRPETGMGKSIETFSTQLALPAGARGGTYSATLMLAIAPIGKVATMPVARPPSAPSTGTPTPSPVPSPNTSPAPRTSPKDTSIPGTPDAMPVARPMGSNRPPPSANNTETSAATTVMQANISPNGMVPATATNGASVSGTANAPAVVVGAVPTITPVGGQLIAPAVTAPATKDSSTNETPTVTSTLPSSAAGGTANANPAPQGVVSPAPAPSGTTSAAVVPSATLAYPVITAGSEILSLTLPFGPSLYDAAGVGPGWHLQTALDLPGPSSRHTASTMPIRTNAGRLFNTVINPDTNQATITFDPLFAAPGSATFAPGSVMLVITIVAGP